jgi:hypothetical protein
MEQKGNTILMEYRKMDPGLEPKINKDNNPLLEFPKI